MKKLAILPVLALAAFFLAGGPLKADPSENGLEHRNSEFSPTRTGWDKNNCDIHPVPDTGSSLALLSLGVIALGSFSILRPSRS